MNIFENAYIIWVCKTLSKCNIFSDVHYLVPTLGPGLLTPSKAHILRNHQPHKTHHFLALKEADGTERRDNKLSSGEGSSNIESGSDSHDDLEVKSLIFD